MYKFPNLLKFGGDISQIWELGHLVSIQYLGRHQYCITRSKGQAFCHQVHWFSVINVLGDKKSPTTCESAAEAVLAISKAAMHALMAFDDACQVREYPTHVGILAYLHGSLSSIQ